MHVPTRSTGLTLAVLAALAVVACGDGQATPTPAATSAPSARPAPSTSPSPSGTAGPGGSAPAPTAGGAFDPDTVALELEVVVGGLVTPLGVTHAGDGSGRVFVLEQRGQVRIVRDGRLEGTPFLNIGDRLIAGGERGLLGFAFHPSYPDDPRLFVNYTDLQGNTVISSFETGSDPDRADPDSESVLLRIEQPFANHNGGAIAFGPDGFLHIATGDGGSGGDPLDNGQSLGTHLGKILRIDVDGTSGDTPYAIPADNPFVDEPDAQPEILHYGLRNPWRMSFDRANGDLWIGDVGQNVWEEVDVARAGSAGLNFGWNRTEGPDCYDRVQCEGDFVDPVTSYGHDFGCAVVGGVVYRGTEQAALAGGYVYSDYCGGNVWLLDPATDGPTGGERVLETGRQISAIGEDEAGEAYATDLGAGELLRFVATPR